MWALSGTTAIRNRTQQLIDEAEDELVLVIGNEAAVTEELIDHLRAAQEKGVNVVIGTVTEVLREVIQDELPDAEVFVSGLEWLNASGAPDDETEISRLLLVDRSSILVSSARGSRGRGMTHEQAVFGRGFDNGLVVIVRRLMATGLLPVADPGIAEPDCE